MTRPYAPAVAVILLPSKRHEELLDVVEDWTRARLLNPAFWICPDDVESDVAAKLSRAESRPPRVTATIIGRNGRRQVDLFEELGRYPFELLRLAAVRDVSPDLSFEEDQDVVLDVLRYYLEHSQPETTRMVRVNLVLAPTQVTGGSAEHLLEPGWHANVIVSPEDRPSSVSFDAFTRETDAVRFNGFVIAHVATAVGLWPGVEAGPYDTHQPRSDWNEVQLQRVTVRGVISEGLVLGVADRVVDECSAPLSPLQDAVLVLDDPHFQAIPPQRVAAVVEQMVQITLALDDGRLAHHSALIEEDDGKRRIHAGQGIREFTAFAVDKTTSLPLYLWDFFARIFTGRLTDSLHGKDGDAVVVADELRSSMDSDFLRRMDSIEADRGRLRAQADEPLPPIRGDVYPRLWEGLRRLSFAILDGSPGPAGVEMPEAVDGSGLTPVLMDANVVYPDCRERWAVPIGVRKEEAQPQAQEELAWLDVPRAKDLLEGLEDRRTRLQARESEMLGRLDSLREQRDDLVDRIAELDFLCQELRDARDWVKEDLEIDELIEESMPEPAGAAPQTGDGDD